MADKLNLSLDELIKKDRDNKKQSGGPKGGKFRKGQNRPGFNRQQRMRQRLSTGNAPNAREKARQLRQNKVRNFGGSRDDNPQQFRNSNRPNNQNSEGRADRENWRKDEEKEERAKPTFSNKLKVTNLSNTISNEDLNVLFKNIGPLKE